MKKTKLLNQPLSSAIAGLGHTDTLVICDAGLPIPANTERIDLALTEGIPAFLDVVRVVLNEMQVERAIIAEEMMEQSIDVYQALVELLGDVPIETVSHEEVKRETVTARAIVRTGEFTPYANVILIAGVVF